MTYFMMREWSEKRKGSKTDSWATIWQPHPPMFNTLSALPEKGFMEFFKPFVKFFFCATEL